MRPTRSSKKVSALTAGKTTQLQKMQAIAAFVQHDIRYVAIELGIGGWQPHAAPDVFSHRYGDCKDKATLMRTMLREIGVESYHVVINTQRGAVTRDAPAHNGFNHVILAIKLPDEIKDPSLIAVMQHPRLGRILFFDPTNEHDALWPDRRIPASQLRFAGNSGRWRTGGVAATAVGDEQYPARGQADARCQRSVEGRRQRKCGWAIGLRRNVGDCAQ